MPSIEIIGKSNRVVDTQEYTIDELAGTVIIVIFILLNSYYSKINVLRKKVLFIGHYTDMRQFQENCNNIFNPTYIRTANLS